MAKYQRLMDEIQQQIEAGIWLPGTRLPSLRQQVAQQGVSLMTVLHAYELLESQGWIVSRPQSGYYVAPRALAPAPLSVAISEQVDINDFVFDVLQATRDPAIVPFGSAFPDPALFPQRQLMRSLANVSHHLTPTDALHNLPPGNATLRQLLAQRYARQGITLSPDEIVITSGALEALNLSLQSLTEPGDYVVIEQPSFYGALQAIERLKLKALAIPVDARNGIDLVQLEEALQRWPVKACWLMTTLQNPLSVTLTPERKQQLVALLARYQVPMIEDDVYAELWAGDAPPLPAKAWDRQGERAALRLIFKVAGGRIPRRLGRGGAACAAYSAAATDEHALYQCADAAGAGRFSCHAALRHPSEAAAADSGEATADGAPGVNEGAAAAGHGQRSAWRLFSLGDAAGKHQYDPALSAGAGSGDQYCTGAAIFGR